MSADDKVQVYGDDEAWWPPGQTVSREETVDAKCAACDILWHVHTDLSGSRLRCRCGEWVDVPAPPSAIDNVSPESAPLIAAREPSVASLGPVRRPQPSAQHDGALRHASARERARWTDRTLIELGLLMSAFLLPGAVVLLGTGGQTRAVLMPLAGLATSVLVFLIGLASPGYAFEGLRRASGRHFAEALLAMGCALGFAYAWMELIRSVSPFPFQDPFAPLVTEVGLPMVVFMVGVVPGIFEEIAFRGLVQGRLSVLFGTRQGIVVTGVAFALAHGVTLAFPIHVAIGLYLCWLRARSGSLLPGMLLHFGYNTTLVVVGT